MNKNYTIRLLAIVILAGVLLFGFSKALLFVGLLKVVLMIGVAFACGYFAGMSHENTK